MLVRLPDNKVIIQSDESKIRQLLTNLINNANKFTQNGTITVELKESNNDISISVKDTGIGIPDNFINKIFDRFSQVDSNNNMYTGTGLGLSICKKLTELMHGSISVESKVNFGSTFKVTLPK